MGVSIHYRGRLTDIQKVKSICDELATIAEKMNWRYTCLKEDWSKPVLSSIDDTAKGADINGHLPLKGIALTLHAKCEALSFFFDENGNLRDPISMVNVSAETLQLEDAWISAKTQFAGPDVHIWIIGLLKYLKKFYIPNLEVQDEGEYWQPENAEILKEKMNFIDKKIAAVSEELSRVARGHIESYSADELATVIETLLHNKFEVED